MADPFTAATLTRALAHTVSEVSEQARFPATSATVAALIVRFSDGRPELRCVAKHSHAAGVARELRFYRRLAPRWPHPAPALLGVDEGDGGTVLVLEDLVAAGYALAPQIGDAELTAAIATLVPFHAAWWNDTAAALPFGDSVTQSAQARPVGAIADHAAALLATDFASARPFLADVPAWRSAFTRRALGHRLTLSHGDYHAFGNIFFATDRPPRVIDWSEVKPALPAHDVAYLLHAAPPDRAHQEALLATYWNGLVAAGVTDYSWALCQWDFRLSLICNQLQAILQRSDTWLLRNAALIELHDARAVLATPPPL